MLNKSISDICYSDIVMLKVDKICESVVLDYKEIIPDDAGLVKHVCALANTRGGYLIFGIKESGDGGYPTEINGINKNKIKKERLENIILAHIVPRLNVNIKEIEIPNEEKSVLLVQIPDSYSRPHYNDINNKFYKRFNFKSEPMTEQEIAYCYQSRFSSNKRIEQYVKKIMVGKEDNLVVAGTIVIPSNIGSRLINTSDYETFKWIEDIKLKSYLPVHRQFLSGSLTPFAHGLISKRDSTSTTETHIHRNGCIHHIHRFSKKNLFNGIPYEQLNVPNNYCAIPYEYLAEQVIHTICFASSIMKHYNYFGDMKIIVNLASSLPSRLGSDPYDRHGYSLEEVDARIEREHSSQHIESHYENITASIMHELANHYGIERCDCFDEDGNWSTR